MLTDSIYLTKQGVLTMKIVNYLETVPVGFVLLALLVIVYKV